MIDYSRNGQPFGLPTEDRNYYGNPIGYGKLVLDQDVNLMQNIQISRLLDTVNRFYTNGWTVLGSFTSPLTDNQFRMGASEFLANGLLSTWDGSFDVDNTITLGAAPTVGDPRYDLVFVEVWVEVVDGPPSIVHKYGNVDYYNAGEYASDVIDPSKADEMTNRLQVRYRTRYIEDEEDMANATVQGKQGSPSVNTFSWDDDRKVWYYQGTVNDFDDATGEVVALPICKILRPLSDNTVYTYNIIDLREKAYFKTATSGIENDIAEAIAGSKSYTDLKTAIAAVACSDLTKRETTVYNSKISVRRENEHMFFFNGTLNDLIYIERFGVSYYSERTVDDNIAGDICALMDDAGYIHVTYEKTIDGANYLYYATNRNDYYKYGETFRGVWKIEQVDAVDVDSNTHGMDFDEEGFIHIAYGSKHNLKYANNRSGKWVNEIVDTHTDSILYIDLKLSSDHKAHIAYSKDELKYVYHDSSYVWNFQTIDASNSGKYVKLQLNYPGGSGEMVAYASDTTGLKYAYRVVSWTVEDANPTAQSVRFVSLARDDTGKAYISCHLDTDQALNYSTNKTGSWVSTTVDTGNVGMGTSIAVTDNYLPRILYYRQSTADSYLAIYNGTSWTLEPIATGGELEGQYPSLVLDNRRVGCVEIYDTTLHTLNNIIGYTTSEPQEYGDILCIYAYEPVNISTTGNIELSEGSVSPMLLQAGKTLILRNIDNTWVEINNASDIAYLKTLAQPANVKNQAEYSETDNPDAGLLYVSSDQIIDDIPSTVLTNGSELTVQSLQDPDWNMIGDWGYVTVESLYKYSTFLYAGTSGLAGGNAKVYQWNGSTWTDISDTGAWSGNTTIGALAEYSDDSTSKLYAGVDDDVYMYTGTIGNWTKIGGDGVNSSWVNTSFEVRDLVQIALEQFTGAWSPRTYGQRHSLFAAIGGPASAAHAQIWKYSCATTTWSLVHDFGTTHDDVWALKEYRRNLFAAVGGATDQAEVWMSYKGSGTWSKVGGDGVYDSWGAGYEDARCLEVYNDRLFVGLRVPAKVWMLSCTSTGDIKWEQVGGDGIRGSWSSGNDVDSLKVYNGKLYAGVDDDIWEFDGISWTKIAGSGIYNSWTTGYNNVRSMEEFEGKLYAGMSGGIDDSDIWSFRYGPEVTIEYDNDELRLHDRRDIDLDPGASVRFRRKDNVWHEVGRNETIDYTEKINEEAISGELPPWEMCYPEYLDYQDDIGTSYIVMSSDANKFFYPVTIPRLYKELLLNRVPGGSGATLRIYYQLRSTGDFAYCNIYRNGEPVGTERVVHVSSGYVAFTEDVSGWQDGDLLQLYANNPNHDWRADVQYFRILGREKDTGYYYNITFITPPYLVTVV